MFPYALYLTRKSKMPQRSFEIQQGQGSACLLDPMQQQWMRIRDKVHYDTMYEIQPHANNLGGT